MTVDFAPIYSNLADDKEIGEIIAIFVNEMPERIALLQWKLIARNWGELHHIAHQLKGSAGSFGFDEISQTALELETTIKTEQPEDQIVAITQRLIELSQRITSEPRPKNSSDHKETVFSK